eukprot:m.124798 g.124798  ORF g.124798 m.124798 type:complete len:101 (+) comp15721_c0_seq1:1733-2035(+)
MTRELGAVWKLSDELTASSGAGLSSVTAMVGVGGAALLLGKGPMDGVAGCKQGKSIGGYVFVRESVWHCSGITEQDSGKMSSKPGVGAGSFAADAAVSKG